MSSVSSTRWQEAQKHELEFWQGWRDLAPYRGLNLDQYWAGERKRFGLPQDFFAGKRVLDVGCGPVGLIHFLSEARLRVRVDPLLCAYTDKLPLPAPGWSFAAAGESLPLPKDFADVAICFNALDHMQDPTAALSELARVLKPAGTLLLMVHTFPRWTMPLLAADRLHPHHWTRRQLLAMIAGPFRIVRQRSERRVFRLSARDRLRPGCWKYMAAGLVLSTTYVVAETYQAVI